MFVGLTLVEKWNTDNNLGTEISIEDQLIKGLKLSFDALFAPQTGCELFIFLAHLHLTSAVVVVVT